MDPPNIWICPASAENLRLTIENPLDGKYIWAFNSKRKGQWTQLRLGDMCLLGNIAERYSLGYKYVSFVVGKEELDNTQDSWPFRSPSGTPWKYAFYLTPPVEVNITKSQFLSARPSGSPQTQIMARGVEAEALRHIIEAAIVDRVKPLPTPS
jgi:hypothetical protein